MLDLAAIEERAKLVVDPLSTGYVSERHARDVLALVAEVRRLTEENQLLRRTANVPLTSGSPIPHREINLPASSEESDD